MKKTALATLITIMSVTGYLSSNPAFASNNSLVGEELIPGVCGLTSNFGDIDSLKSTILFQGESFDPINEKPLMVTVVSNTSDGVEVKFDNITATNIKEADGSDIAQDSLGYSVSSGGTEVILAEGEVKTFAAGSSVMFLPNVDYKKSELKSSQSHAIVRSTLTVTCK